MLKTIAVGSAVMLVLLALGAFQKTRAEEQDSSRSPQAEKNLSAYRLDYAINEVEGGKKISSRQYSMNIKPDGSNEVKIGTRVPIEPKRGEFQYLDVGTNIWSQIRDRGGEVELVARADISSFALADQGQGYGLRPPIRQLKIDASTIPALGKPMVLGSVDDPNSGRHFQLEVTVTRVR